MIVLVKSYGDNSNRLIQSAHYEAYCLERGVKFVNLTMEDYIGIFPGIGCSRKWHKLLQIIITVLRRLNILRSLSLSTSSDLDKYLQSPLVLVEGWSYRDNTLTAKYRSRIAKKYEVRKSILKNNLVYQKISDSKLSGKIVIGVHIRRGDYKVWENGKYYYDDSVYLRYMKLLKKILNNEGKEVCFVLFSNEVISIRQDAIHIVSNNTWSIDHHLMRMCHYLIGPPSTFTMWASYTGKVKLYHIANPSLDIRLADFSIRNG